MNGPEHYREAERLLESAREDVNIGSAEETYSLAAAQVHATLALTAATAERTRAGGVELVGDPTSWRAAIHGDRAESA